MSIAPLQIDQSRIYVLQFIRLRQFLIMYTWTLWGRPKQFYWEIQIGLYGSWMIAYEEMGISDMS